MKIIISEGMKKNEVYRKLIEKVKGKYKYEMGQEYQAGEILFYKKSWKPNLFLNPRFMVGYYELSNSSQISIVVWNNEDFDYVVELSKWIESKLKIKVEITKNW